MQIILLLWFRLLLLQNPCAKGLSAPVVGNRTALVCRTDKLSLAGVAEQEFNQNKAFSVHFSTFNCLHGSTGGQKLRYTHRGHCSAGKSQRADSASGSGCASTAIGGCTWIRIVQKSLQIQDLCSPQWGKLG